MSEVKFSLLAPSKNASTFYADVTRRKPQSAGYVKRDRRDLWKTLAMSRAYGKGSVAIFWLLSLQFGIMLRPSPPFRNCQFARADTVHKSSSPVPIGGRYERRKGSRTR